jgi:hypothetical protein
MSLLKENCNSLEVQYVVVKKNYVVNNANTQILHFSKTDVPAGINYGILELLKQNFLRFSTADFRKKKRHSNIQHHINKTKNTNSIFHSAIQFQK